MWALNPVPEGLDMPREGVSVSKTCHLCCLGTVWTCVVWPLLGSFLFLICLPQNQGILVSFPPFDKFNGGDIVS